MANLVPTVTNLRASTRVRDEGYYRLHISPTFGSTPLNKLDRTVLRQWVADLVDPGGDTLAPATGQKAVQILNKCVRAALDDRLIAVNPVERLPLPEIEREEMRYLTHRELAQLVDTIDPRYRAFALLGGYGGLRLGELLGLRWGRVDLLGRQVLRERDPHRPPRPRDLRATKDQGERPYRHAPPLRV